jgi:hypothetical protein
MPDVDVKFDRSAWPGYMIAQPQSAETVSIRVMTEKS